MPQALERPPSTTTREPVAAARDRAFTSASSSARPGSESAALPPLVPSQTRSPQDSVGITTPAGRSVALIAAHRSGRRSGRCPAPYANSAVRLGLDALSEGMAGRPASR